MQDPRSRGWRGSVVLGLAGWALGCQAGAPLDTPAPPPASADVVAVMDRVNDAFMARWPAPGQDIAVTNGTAPSNVWSRAVYFEGLMALYGQHREPAYLAYAEAWGESHAWGLRSGPTTRFADDQCAGQTYLDLYAQSGGEPRIADIEASVDAMVANEGVADWTWIDAIQMAMPVFARVGALRKDPRIFEKMYALYTYTRNTAGSSGLYSPSDHLWWRDATYAPPRTEPNGAGCYWSRGNGWVYVGLTRVLDALPEDAPHRAEYVADFVAMSEALRAVRRDDGFWNVSLHDPTHFGGRELTGTSLFVAGMAWGVRHGLLSDTVYRPLVTQSWSAMVTEAVHADGVLGYVQGTAAGPADGQPVTHDSTPNTADFGVGCFLLAGSEMAKLR